MPPVCSYTPYIHTPPKHLYAPTPPYAQTPPYVPMLPCACVCSRGYLHVIWDVGAPSVGCPQGRGVPAQVSITPTNYMLPICSREYLHVLWGKLYLCWGLGSVSTSAKLLASVSTSIGCPLCFILYLSCSSLCLKSLLPWLQLLLLQ